MPIRTIGVIGAGTMVGGIAQVAATRGFKIILIDVSSEIVANGLKAVESHLARMAAKGKMSEDEKRSALGRISVATDYSQLKPADIVIEVARENYDLKSDILKRIDQAINADSIIASNTSSISITQLAALISRPERFVGMHFFNPVPLMTLVEIVRGLQTSDTTHDAIVALAKQLGKSPITVKNAPGFVVNRILLPMVNEAFFVLGEGDASAAEIDEGMKLGCNHPIGPQALAHMIGLDVVLAIIQVLYDEFADSRYRPCPLLKEMAAAGHLGRKSGRGIYDYPGRAS